MPSLAYRLGTQIVLSAVCFGEFRSSGNNVWLYVAVNKIAQPVSA
jgi:hypothetical protein